MYYQFENSKVKHEVKSTKELFELLTTHDYEQIEWNEIIVYERLFSKPGTYQEKKAALQNIAIQWQAAFDNFDYSYRDLAEWADFFGEYGKRYGLLTEFKENGIHC